MHNEEEYSDIINLPHHVSENRAHMPLSSRAAQFAPFAALSGYSEAVAETARLTESRVSLGEDALSELDVKLTEIIGKPGQGEAVRTTFFCPDSRKSGGSYAVAEGFVLKVDRTAGKLILADGLSVSLSDIIAIKPLKS